MPDLVGKYVGRYHILEQLGKGGMAVVFKAYDTRLERDVAIKFIRIGAFAPDILKEMLNRFEREAKSLARMDHPNIVGVFDYGEYEDAPYLVMQYLPGGTLKHDVPKPMPADQAARLLLPIARALEYAHERKIIHRDVKPANILITQSGEPMLSDFGIAKILEEQGMTLTASGVGVGTPEYMAPEQWTGKVVPATDIYSLGVVLYELVTGRRPYEADTPAAVFQMQILEPLTRPHAIVPDLPDEVEKVILKALAKAPDDRYESMGAFAAALEGLVGAGSMPARDQDPAVAALLDMAEDLESQGNREVAIATYSRALSLCPAGSEQAKEIEAVIANLEHPEEVEEEVAEIIESQPPALPSALPPSAPFPAISESGTGDVIPPPVITPQLQEQRAVGKPWWRAWYIWAGAFVVIAGLIVIALLLSANFGQKGEEMVSVEASPNETTPPSATFTPVVPTLTPMPMLGIGSTMVSPKDEMVLVYVPEGEFEMGQKGIAEPVHTVYLDAYWIDQTEVTNVMYATFLNEMGYKSEEVATWLDLDNADTNIHPSGEGWWSLDGEAGNLPIVNVSWYGADAYCSWAGRRLPTEAEWEKAARGTDGRTYPWGEEIDNSYANGGVLLNFPMPVGSYPKGASPYGALDMSGNVWEWVADWYDDGYYWVSPDDNPTGPTSGEFRVQRGGSFGCEEINYPSARRQKDIPSNQDLHVGFRCASSGAP